MKREFKTSGKNSKKVEFWSRHKYSTSNRNKMFQQRKERNELHLEYAREPNILPWHVNWKPEWSFTRLGRQKGIEDLDQRHLAWVWKVCSRNYTVLCVGWPTSWKGKLDLVQIMQVLDIFLKCFDFLTGQRSQTRGLWRYFSWLSSYFCIY